MIASDCWRVNPSRSSFSTNRWVSKWWPLSSSTGVEVEKMRIDSIDGEVLVLVGVDKERREVEVVEVKGVVEGGVRDSEVVRGVPEI